MTFTPETVAWIDMDHLDVAHALHRLPARLLAQWHPTLATPRAKEYLAQGVCRRLGIMRRCIDRVFEICPPGRVEKLGADERIDIEIALHAFVINVHGLLDNLAWVLASEANPGGVRDRRTVGLFRKELEPLLPPRALEYLRQAKIVDWHRKYAQSYRDALAHRIPLYVPPAALAPAEAQAYQELEARIADKLNRGDLEGVDGLLEAQRKIGSLFPVFAHALSGDDASPPAYFHPQLIADSRTVIEIVRAVSPVELSD